MKYIIAICLLGLLFGATSSAEVVRPAPAVKWVDAAGKERSSTEFKGQPLVVLITPEARTWGFGRQLVRLRGTFEKLAAHKTVFIAAFSREPGIVPSNIPFAVAADGPKVAFDFGVEDGFAIAIVSPDGNIDYITDKVLPGQRVLDVIRNSYAEQVRIRRR
jgi:hypothetical protein